MNWDNYKFRCSSLPLLMTMSKNKIDLSETVKSELLKIFIQEKYNRREIIINKYLIKGLEQEDLSIELYNSIYNKKTKKNERYYSSNQHLFAGTPDLLAYNLVIDIKSCWDLYSFSKKNASMGEKDYYYQLLGYMILTKRKKAQLCYTLIDNEESVIAQELSKYMYNKNLSYEKTKDLTEVEAVEKQIRLNHTFTDIPAKDRLKLFNYKYSLEEHEKLNLQLTKCREHLKILEL